MLNRNLFIALAITFSVLFLAQARISEAAESQIQQVRYSVSIDKKRDKFVFVLEIDQRLAVGHADVRRWKISKFVSEPVNHVELGPDARFYWLDEFYNLQVDVDRDSQIITIDTRNARKIERSKTQSGAYLAATREEDQYAVSRDWGTDFTYRLSFASQDMGQVETQSSSVLGLNLAQYGRLQATIEAGESSTTGKFDLSARNIFYEVDTDTGYAIKLGDLNTFGSGNLPGVQYVGMHIGSNLTAKSINYVAGKFGNLESIALLSRPATVEIDVNDRVVSTLSAGVGSLSVHDIPLDDGFNVVQISIIYSDGSTDTVTRNLMSGGRRIGVGRTEHYFSLGLLEQSINDTDEPNNVWLGASLVHGVTSSSTAEIAGYGRGGDNRAAGMELSWAGHLPQRFNFSSRLGLSVNKETNQENATSESDDISGDRDDEPGIGWYWTGFLEKSINSNHFSVSGSWSDKNFRAINQNGFTRLPQWSTRASFSHSFHKNTSIAANVNLERQHDEDTVVKRLGFRLQQRYKHLNLSAALNYQQHDDESDLTASLSFRMPFGTGRSQRLSVRHSMYSDFSTQSVRATKTLASREIGSSWSAELNTRQNEQAQNTQQINASIFTRLPFAEGSVTATLKANSQQTNLTGKLGGTIVHTDRKFYFTYPVSRSFVLVDTHGTAPVELTMNGTDLGTVNSQGKLLIPKVSSHSFLNVKIKPNSLPGNFSGKQLAASTRFASGLGHLSLPVTVSRQATARLLDSEGEVLPAGSVVSSSSSNNNSTNTYHGIVGNKGHTYLSDLNTDSPVIVNTGESTCVVHIKQRWPEDQVVDLGALTCL